MAEISVIVPIYNTEQFLHRCIDSMLSQSFTDFELVLVDDGAAPEGHHHFHLVSVSQELGGMIQLEVEVVVVGLRPHVNLLNLRLGTVGLDLFLLFLLFVKIFLIIHHLAYRRVGLRGDLHQIQLIALGNLQSFPEGDNLRLEILSYYAYYLGGDVFINIMLGFLLVGRNITNSISRVWCALQSSFSVYFF